MSKDRFVATTDNEAVDEVLCGLETLTQKGFILRLYTNINTPLIGFIKKGVYRRYFVVIYTDHGQPGIKPIDRGQSLRDYSKVTVEVVGRAVSFVALKHMQAHEICNSLGIFNVPTPDVATVSDNFISAS